MRVSGMMEGTDACLGVEDWDVLCVGDEQWDYACAGVAAWDDT